MEEGHLPVDHSDQLTHLATMEYNIKFGDVI